MLITYFVPDPGNIKLTQATKRACNFWNHFVIPDLPLVVRVESFKPFNPWSSVTGTSSNPQIKDGVKYGRIRFNRKLLDGWSEMQVAATVAHEIGHSLGYGWSRWDALYDRKTGRFSDAAVAQLASLADMEVEREFGEPQAYSHWDEGRFGDELMTPFKDQEPHVLPVTIDVMALLGHQLRNRLTQVSPLGPLLDLPPQDEIVAAAKSGDIDLAHKSDAPVFEPIPAWGAST